jgi:hypothetical protein
VAGLGSQPQGQDVRSLRCVIRTSATQGEPPQKNKFSAARLEWLFFPARAAENPFLKLILNFRLAGPARSFRFHPQLTSLMTPVKARPDPLLHCNALRIQRILEQNRS